MSEPSAPQSSPFQALLAVLVCLTYSALISGVSAHRQYSTAPWAQTVLLWHMLVGTILGVVLVVLIRVHPFRRSRFHWARTLLGHGLGHCAAATGTVALLLGLAMPLMGNTAAHPDFAWIHGAAAMLFTWVMALHIVISWQVRALSSPTTRRLSRLIIPVTLIVTLGIPWELARLVRVPEDSKPIPKTYKKIGYGKQTVFTPGREVTSHKQFIPVSHIAGSFSCGTTGCHTEIVREWKSSAHRHAASNDHYRAQVKLRMHDVKAPKPLGARFCSACHEPIAVLSGEVDPTGRGIEFDENLNEGISCLTCHRMTGLVDTFGNGSYEVSPGEPYLFQGRADWTEVLARASIRAKPEPHKEALMRPLLKSPEACAPCHQLYVGAGINPNGFFVVQETYDEYHHSKFAGSEFDPRVTRCQDCHMPLVASGDPAARGGKHHSHRFPGANTMRPFLDGDTEQLEVIRKFLTSGVVTLKVVPDGAFTAGAKGTVRVRVTNEGVGHRFPTGTVDMHDIWIEIKATARDKTLFESGQIDPVTLNVDPDAATYKTTPLDPNGEWLFRRDMWNLARYKMSPNPVGPLVIGQSDFGVLGPRPDYFNIASLGYFRSIWPGTVDERVYSFPVPKDCPPITVSARLRYRKSNQKFTNWVFNPAPLREGSGYTGKRKMGVALPIVDMASDTVLVRVKK
jgi:hypothetical protein